MLGPRSCSWDLHLPTADLHLPTVNLHLPTVDLHLPTVDLRHRTRQNNPPHAPARDRLESGPALQPRAFASSLGYFTLLALLARSAGLWPAFRTRDAAKPVADRRSTLSAFRAECGISRLAFPSSRRLEEFQLRLLEEAVVLEDADDLEQVRLLVIAVHFDLRDQVRQHGAEGNDRVDALGAE